MKPYLHAERSAKKWGGNPEDYLAIHDFIDSSKAHFPDVRHRALLHSSFGIYITEMIFGTCIINSANKRIQVRDIAEDHVLEDLGFIPTVQDYLQDMPFYPWIKGRQEKATPQKAKPQPKTLTEEDIKKLIEDAKKEEKKKNPFDIFPNVNPGIWPPINPPQPPTHPGWPGKSHPLDRDIFIDKSNPNPFYRDGASRTFD